jgi:hypothetical protein
LSSIWLCNRQPLTVFSMQRCPCFQAYAMSSKSSESPGENKANLNRLSQTPANTVSSPANTRIAATLVFYFFVLLPISFHLCVPCVGGTVTHLIILL